MSNETGQVAEDEPGRVDPREGGAATARKRPAYLGKMMWPVVLVVAGLMLYSLFSPKSSTKPAPIIPGVPEEGMRTAPRAAARPIELKMPAFTPTMAITPSSAAVAPLPPGSAAMLPRAPAVAASGAGGAHEDSAAVRAEKEVRRRRMAPLMIEAGDGVGNPRFNAVDDETPKIAVKNNNAGQGAARPAMDNASSPERLHAFLGQSSDSDERYKPASLRRAGKSGDLQVFEGKMISAILETPVHTALPGYVRAMVDENIYAESGRQIVIPRMSRLVGEYDSRVVQGQTRVMVIWRRLILPDGNSLQIASYGTDGLGRAGMTGDVDNHFFQRYGAALVVSAMGVAIASQSNSNSRSTTVLPGGGFISETNPSNALATAEALKSLQATVGGMLAQQANIRPTIQIPQGSAVKVFVSRDLDFSEGAVTARR